jgi:hypothetical protein
MRKKDGIHEALWAKVQYKVVCRKGADLGWGIAEGVRDHLGPFGGRRPGMTVTNAAWIPAWERLKG